MSSPNEDANKSESIHRTPAQRRSDRRGEVVSQLSRSHQWRSETDGIEFTPIRARKSVEWFAFVARATLAMTNGLIKPYPFERRAAGRPATPKCVRCDTDANVKCVIRYPQVLYFRCGRCGTVKAIVQGVDSAWPANAPPTPSS